MSIDHPLEKARPFSFEVQRLVMAAGILLADIDETNYKGIGTVPCSSCPGYMK
jgi:hypothetical protein